MADMAAEDQLEIAWRELADDGRGRLARSCPSPTSIRRPRSRRSSARHGGVVCTSTNAAAVMTWAWQRGEKLMMLPDQHLGRNTALQAGRAARSHGRVGSARGRRRSDAGAGAAARSCCCGRGTARSTPGSPSRRSRRSGRSIRTARSSPTPNARSTSCRRRTSSGSTEYIIDTVKSEPEGIGLGGGDGDPPRQPPRRPGGAGPHRGHARSVRLPVFDDVPRVAEPPALDPRGARRRRRSTTRSSCPTRPSAGRSWRSIACSRFSDSLTREET